MDQTPETIQPQVRMILTGHYRETGGYQNWRSRGTESWLLIDTLGGSGRFGQAGIALITRPGDLVLLQPGTCHDYGTAASNGHWDLLWAHFHPRSHWHEWLNWPEHTPGRMHLRLTEPVIRQKIVTCLQEAHRMATGGLRQREAFAMNALEEALLWCGTQNPQAEPGRLDDRVRDCLDYLCSHLSTPITLERLAERAALSPSRLAHLFRAQVGMTPQQFLEQQRLARARQLLELSGRSIGDIATEVGYESPFYFTLRFKKRMGLSPREYRQEWVMRSFPKV